MIATMIWVTLIVPDDPETLSGWVSRFPEVQADRTVENLLYLVGLIMVVPMFLGLYRGLRNTRLAHALFGSTLGILGVFAMMVSSTPHVAHFPISDIYETVETTPEALDALGYMWQATRGIFDAMLYVGFLVVPIGLTILGFGMLKSALFGKGIGSMTVALGVIGVIAGTLQMVFPAAVYGAGSYLAIIVSSLLLGWKLFRISTVSLDLSDAEPKPPTRRPLVRSSFSDSGF